MTFPFNGDKPNPYRNGVCHYGLKLHVKNSVVPCGLDARLYEVSRSEDSLSNHGATPSVKFKVWLCDNHRDSLKRDGFTLTLDV